jgi:two-component system chemotaxis response regulator CheY
MAFNILIVDDSMTVRRTLAKVVGLCDLDVGDLLQAANGREALELLQGHWVDLVLSDLNMPEMNGVELIEQMAADPMLQSVPVVVISTEGSRERIDQLVESGIRGFVRKPFTPEQVREVIIETLGVADS